MDLTFERYHDLALKFLSYRPRSEKEVIDYLKKKKIHELIIVRIINSLKEKKFIDDFEFASWWLDQRTRSRPKSIRIIKMELKQKGITQDIMDRLEPAKDIDEKSALKLVEKNLRKYEKLPEKEAYLKLAGFLARRGFDYDMIKKVIPKRLKS